jgi:hypothetical protein
VKPRSEKEQDAYHAGVLAALKLVRETNLDYAEKVMEASWDLILSVRQELSDDDALH